MKPAPISKPPSQQIVTRGAVRFSGPIPDPDSLLRYNEIVPGSADRLIALAEGESRHRRDQEQKQLEANIWLARENQREAFRGQLFGFMIGIAALTAGSITAVRGAPVAGGIIGGAAIVGLVTAFIIGRKTRA